jgi:hypothetical protein
VDPCNTVATLQHDRGNTVHPSTSHNTTPPVLKMWAAKNAE